LLLGDYVLDELIVFLEEGSVLGFEGHKFDIE
jgi:hypothetical protein